MKPIYIIIGYLIFANVLGFLLCFFDKRKAQKGLWRISEKALLLTGLFGGCFGLLGGMYAFRHKTKHWKFKILAPAECVLWLILGGVVWVKYAYLLV